MDKDRNAKGDEQRTILLLRLMLQVLIINEAKLASNKEILRGLAAQITAPQPVSHEWPGVR